MFVSAKNLPNMDLTSKTDPFCVVDIKTVGNLPNVRPMERVGVSEVIMDTLNPQFAFAFEMNYHFEMSQDVVVTLYDKDSGAPLTRTSSHTLIGTDTFNLATLMNKSGSNMAGPLVSRRAGSATVSVRGEALANTRDCLTVSFSGKKLANKVPTSRIATSPPLFVSRPPC